ncbi:BQ5605_C008g05027 [Microbotryum silenes-dioicae]|uniref:BQ5605_C008g05027 protein n=1 Tax=Microbotryum silenes-dioicae TaxID=796604 RepID=A0A2X0N5V4_9BASI|nr:BQ5605_C008g05027 [Microbotryum silenes-dioicae]
MQQLHKFLPLVTRMEVASYLASLPVRSKSLALILKTKTDDIINADSTNKREKARAGGGGGSQT